MAEINFEYLALALEPAGINNRGTLTTPPDHYLNLSGTLDPKEEIMQPDESRGTLEEFYRSKRVREYSEWEGKGGLDLDLMPLVIAMMLNGSVAASSVAGSSLAKDWDALPNITGDNLRTATMFWGTPAGDNLHRAAFGVANSLEIAADATGTDGTTMTLGGFAQDMQPIDPQDSPALPAQTVGDLVVPGDWQVWLDVGSTAIGTTPLQGEVISVTHTLENNNVRKFIPRNDPSLPKTYTRIGRGKRHLKTVVGFELPNNSRYKQWRGRVPVKLRVRHNGDYIETVNSNPLYSFLEVDTYGPWTTPAWGEYEGTNRRLDLTIMSEVNNTVGRSFAMRVRNRRTVL